MSRYISLISQTGANYTSLIASFNGGETAGSVANSGFSSNTFRNINGETAGSVACSSGSSGSSCSSSGSFSAIA